jgi:hypothetical protein
MVLQIEITNKEAFPIFLEFLRKNPDISVKKVNRKHASKEDIKNMMQEALPLYRPGGELHDLSGDDLDTFLDYA